MAYRESIHTRQGEPDGLTESAVGIAVPISKSSENRSHLKISTFLNKIENCYENVKIRRGVLFLVKLPYFRGH